MPKKPLLVIALCLAVSLNAQKTKTATQQAPNSQSQEFRAALAKVLHARFDAFSELKTGTTVFQLPAMTCSIGGNPPGPSLYNCATPALSSTDADTQYRNLTSALSASLSGYSQCFDHRRAPGVIGVIGAIQFCHHKFQTDVTVVLTDKGIISLGVWARAPDDQGEPVEILHARALNDLGRYKEAMDAFKAIGQRDVWVNRGEGNYEYDRTATSNGNDEPSTLLGAGDAYKAMHVLSQRIDSSKRLYKTNPQMLDEQGASDLAGQYDESARIQAAIGRLIPALRDLDTAIDTLPKNAKNVRHEAEFHYHRALILSESGRFGDAAKACRESFDIDQNEMLALGYGDQCSTIAALASEQTPGEPSDLNSTADSPRASSIQSEIDAIARSKQYSAFPSATETRKAGQGANDSPERIVENGTPYTLHVLMSGPTDHRIDLAPGGSTSISVPPGAYRVAARVDGSHVLPFYGEQTLKPGVVYTSHFYISSN